MYRVGYEIDRARSDIERKLALDIASENDVIVVPNENNEQEIDSLPIKNISNLPLYPDGNGTGKYLNTII